ncbi:MAG: hypothetical protein H3C53_02915 [Trueperaceae bacterium]|nr:hypothetical protein [Trueperaceae bacterium]
MEEFIAIGRNSVIILGSAFVFAGFFVVVSTWLAGNTVEPEHEAGY